MTTTQAIYLRVPNWIGDVCMSLPCLDTLLATNRPVIVCARNWARDLLAAYPLTDFVAMKGNVRADCQAVRAHRKQAGYTGARGLLLPDSLSSALVFRFAGIPSAGYRDDGRSVLLRWPIGKPSTPMHAVESWFHLTQAALSAWNLPKHTGAPNAELGLRLTAEHSRTGHQALKEAGLDGTPFVLIAPTATGLHRGRVKVWPGFDALTRALQACGHTVLMSPPESEQVAAREQAPTALCLPPLPLGGFATLTRSASLVICNDSGVSHIAAASGARQLTLFGVTDPARTGPWSPSAICVGQADAWPEPDAVIAMALSALQGSTHEA